MTAKYLIAGLMLITVTTWTNTFYIEIKAELAQILIRSAWHEALRTGEKVVPWSWADTGPVARLTSASGADLLVLSGAHGSALAFGPGHVDGTVFPGEAGTSVIAGHRDTHFSFLEDLSLNDAVNVQDRLGEWHEYRVGSLSVADIRQGESVDFDLSKDQLYLITCYPFDAVEPGGPYRYVVKLERR